MRLTLVVCLGLCHPSLVTLNQLAQTTLETLQTAVRKEVEVLFSLPIRRLPLWLSLFL